MLDFVYQLSSGKIIHEKVIHKNSFLIITTRKCVVMHNSYCKIFISGMGVTHFELGSLCRFYADLATLPTLHLQSELVFRCDILIKTKNINDLDNVFINN